MQLCLDFTLNEQRWDDLYTVNIATTAAAVVATAAATTTATAATTTTTTTTSITTSITLFKMSLKEMVKKR